MSNIYIQEPGTNGKVVLATSLGQLEIELWSREAPKTCRNFVRRCLDGYYDKTIFHRIIPNFIAQGGCSESLSDIRLAEKDESAAHEMKSIEAHQRLRFVRRGLVACAATHGDLEDDSPLAASARNEFFITLDACPELQGKHTIFGKLTSKTLFNALKLHDVQLDANNRPLYPPKIEKVAVVNNPFPDIAADSARIQASAVIEQSTTILPTSSKKAALRKNCLSFAGEEEADDDDGACDDEPQPKRAKVYLKSAHDFDDPILSKTHGEVCKSDAGMPTTDVLDGPLLSESEDDAQRKTLSKVEEIRSHAEKLKLVLANDKIATNSAIPPLLFKINKAGIDAVNSSDDSPYHQQRSVENARKQQVQLGKKDKVAHEQQVLDRLARFKGKLNSFKNIAQPVSTETKQIAVDDNADTRNTDAGQDDVALFRHTLKCTVNVADDDDDGGLMVINGESSAATSNGSKPVIARDASTNRTVEHYDLYDPRNPLNKQRREESKKRKEHRGIK